MAIAIGLPSWLRWFGLSAKPAARLHELAPRLQAVTALPANWDSYGARPVDAANITEAVKLLRALVTGATPLPSVVPVADGSLQLEWHEGGIDLEIRVAPAGRDLVSFEEERRKGAEWEGPIAPNLARLKQAVAELTQRRG